MISILMRFCIVRAVRAQSASHWWRWFVEKKRASHEQRPNLRRAKRRKTSDKKSKRIYIIDMYEYYHRQLYKCKRGQHTFFLSRQLCSSCVCVCAALIYLEYSCIRANTASSDIFHVAHCRLIFNRDPEMLTFPRFRRRFIGSFFFSLAECSSKSPSLRVASATFLFHLHL